MADTRNITNAVNRGLAWSGLASSMVWILDIVANVIILALWISPEEYGIAALAITIFPILDLAADLGLSAAIIQRDDHSPGKLSTVFWLNFLISLVIFATIWLALGPALSSLHGQPIVGLMLTVYGIKPVWQNIYFVPIAMMRKELRFKEISVVRTLANFIEFSAKVAFAATGFGIWCFVLGPLCREVCYSIGIQLCHPWRPRLVLRIREALPWITFGLKSTAHQILFHIYTNVDYQIVGYYFGPEANGFYRLAYDIVLEPCRMIGLMLHQVALAAYSKLRHVRDKLIDQLVSFTRLSLVVMLGFLCIIFVATEDALGSLWGERWIPATDAARILCLVGVLRALSFVIPPLLDGLGRPGLTLIYTSVASVVLPSFFFVGAHFFGHTYNYLAVAWAWALGYPVAFAVLAVLALKLLHLRAIDYLRRVMGIPGCALIAVGVGLLARWQGDSLPRLVRLLLVTAVIVATFLTTLAYWQKISPRSIYRAIKG